MPIRPCTRANCLLAGVLLMAAACGGPVAPVSSPGDPTAPPGITVAPPMEPQEISRTYAHDAVIVDLEGRTVGTIPNLPPLAAELALSPDGHTIAFSMADRPNSDTQLYTIGVDGTNLTRLTDDAPRVPNGMMQPASRSSAPTWSPDGDRLAFYGLGELVTISADGTDRQSLRHCCLPYGILIAHPRWSPDGSRIIYSIAWGWETVTLSDRAVPVPMPDAGGRIFDADWSSDGSQLAFARAEGGNEETSFDIWVMGADGGVARPLVSDPGASDVGPMWSPDAKLIAFTRITDHREVWIVDVLTGEARSVRNGTVLDWFSPDRLIVARQA